MTPPSQLLRSRSSGMDGMPSSLAALPELRQSSRVILTSNAGDLEVFHVEHARYAELAKTWLPAPSQVVGTQRPARLADVRGVSSFRVIAGARSFQEAFTRMTVGVQVDVHERLMMPGRACMTVIGQGTTICGGGGGNARGRGRGC